MKIQSIFAVYPKKGVGRIPIGGSKVGRIPLAGSKDGADSALDPSLEGHQHNQMGRGEGDCGTPV